MRLSNCPPLAINPIGREHQNGFGALFHRALHVDEARHADLKIAVIDVHRYAVAFELVHEPVFHPLGVFVAVADEDFGHQNPHLEMGEVGLGLDGLCYNLKTACPSPTSHRSCRKIGKFGSNQNGFSQPQQGYFEKRFIPE
jgi:hypothetical protein